MILINKTYTSNGREYDVLDDLSNPTGQKCFKTSVGEKHIPDGGGFVPFLLNGAEINFGSDNGLEFTSDRQIIKRAGQIICSSFKFRVQAFIGGNWVDQPHGVAERHFHEGEVFRDGGWVTDEDKCTGFLSFPDAHVSFGAQNPYNLFIGLEAGGGELGKLGFRFRAPASGQVRFIVELDGLKKLPTDWEWLWYSYPPFIVKEDRKKGIRVKDLEWTWEYDESPFRDITAENNPDGTKKISIIFGVYDYTANEWLTVYPDTWGPTESGDTACDYDGTFYDNLGDNDVAAGIYSNPITTGLTFSGVTASGTADDGCFIRGYNGLKDGLGSLSLQLRISSVDNPSAWSSSNFPSNAPVEAGAVAWSPSGSGTVDSPEIKSLIQYRFDDAGWTSGILAFVWEDNGSDDQNAYYIGDENYANPPELTIVYTPGGGGGLSIPVAMHHYTKNIGM